jgi:MFS superfamily sulfate permease-like transporter
VSQASSFTPVALTPRAAASAGWRASFFAALDGAAFTIPLTLGSVTLVFAKVGGDVMAAAILTTLLAIALLQLTTARAQRPLLYSARFFEATTLASMMDRAIELMPAWGLADTSAVRLALLCTVVAGAGVVVGVLFAARADRFSRHIPTPVFAAFSNSIAFGLLISQAGTLRHLLSGEGVAIAIALATASFAIGVGIRKWLPRWPAAACALTFGLLAGSALFMMGAPVAMLGSSMTRWAPAAAAADFGAVAVGISNSVPMLAWLFTNIAILGTMMFINTSITAQAMSHADDRPREKSLRLLWTSACLAVSGALGAAPLSASLQSSNAATRHAPLAAPVLLFSALTIGLVAATGALAMVPMAAVVGALVCEAVYMVDRPSMKLLRSWAANHKLSRQQREDLALVALVTATAVFLNMVAAVVAGLLLGLLMFATRHVTPPVKATWDGTQMASNCARSRGDVHLLAAHGSELRVFELQGDLFFGTVDALDRSLRGALHGVRCIVLDWTAVRHVDTSAIQALGKFEKAARDLGIAVFHVDPATSSRELAQALKPALKDEPVAADLDRALELAENHLLQQHASERPANVTSFMEAMSLFSGMDEPERQALEAAMTQRLVPPGEAVVRMGDPGDDIMVVLQGSASVMVGDGAGHMVRVAGLRRGAVIGEISFFDHSLRSANVVATDEVLVAVLDRAAYARLSEERPRLVQKLIANIAVYLATRLRHTTALAAARHNVRRG